MVCTADHPLGNGASFDFNAHIHAHGSIGYLEPNSHLNTDEHADKYSIQYAHFNANAHPNAVK